jgi:hypothetical protein
LWAAWACARACVRACVRVCVCVRVRVCAFVGTGGVWRFGCALGWQGSVVLATQAPC